MTKQLETTNNDRHTVLLCLCVKMGCSRDNAIECLRDKEPDKLTDKQFAVTGATFNFVPTIDYNMKFLQKSPLELLKSGEFQRKNILLGMNSHEGSYFVIYEVETKRDLSDRLKEDLNKNITREQYQEIVKKVSFVDSSSDVVTDTIASIYSLPCGSEGNTGDDDAVTYFKALDGVFGDVWFKCPVVQTAKTYAKKVIRCVYHFLARRLWQFNISTQL